MILVLRSKARRSCWETLSSSKWRCASDLASSTWARRLLGSLRVLGLVVIEVSSVITPPGSRGTLPKPAWKALLPLVKVELFKACSAGVKRNSTSSDVLAAH